MPNIYNLPNAEHTDIAELIARAGPIGDVARLADILYEFPEAKEMPIDLYLENMARWIERCIDEEPGLPPIPDKPSTKWFIRLLYAGLFEGQTVSNIRGVK